MTGGELGVSRGTGAGDWRGLLLEVTIAGWVFFVHSLSVYRVVRSHFGMDGNLIMLRNDRMLTDLRSCDVCACVHVVCI